MFKVTKLKKRLISIILIVTFTIPTSFSTATFAVDLSKEKTIYTVATAHLDTQWNWDVKTTINSYLPKTFNNNFDLFEKYPDYEFNFEGAFRYDLIKEYYPEAYEQIKEYVDQGRWNVSGSSWDAGDVNIPSSEALMRNILLGNGFFKDEFGKTSSDIFLPDCFGFGYALPSIASHMGLKGFSTQKLTWGSAYGIPFDIGRWQGVDGSSVIAALNPGSYTTTYTDSLSAPDSSWVDRVNENGSKYGVNAAYSYHGTGDTGGSPSETSVETLQNDIDKGFDPDTNIQVISASSDQLYKDITSEQEQNLPTYDGELVMSTHAVGGYTSRTISKRWNRHNELLADATERTSVMADWIGGAPYPKGKLDTAWKRFIWHHMHDDLPGTSLPSAYQITWNDYILSLNQFAGELTNGVGAIARTMDTETEGIPVVVYNPISKERKDIVEAEINFDEEVPESIKVFDPDGNEVPSQMSTLEGDSAKVLFLAEMPSIGYKVYDVRPSESKSTIDTGLEVTTSTVENDYYKVTINEDGDISSIYDKVNEKELLSAPARLELFDNNSRSWPSWEILYDDINTSPREYVSGPVEVEIVEDGPARVALKVIRETAESTFTQTIRLSAGDDAQRIDVDNNVDWKTKASLLKAAFPLNVSNPNATYDLGLGTIQRGNNTENLYEVPAQQWADITDISGEYGVSILNDCKYGWDKPEDNILRLTLIHTPKYSFGNNKQDIQDIGENRFLYSIYGHEGDWVEGDTVTQGERVNQPLRAFQTVKHDGDFGKNISFLNIDNPQITVKALKQAEDSNEVIIRVQETSGNPASNVTLSIGNGITEAKEVNGFEEYVGPAVVENGELKFDIGKYKPKTFAVTLADPATTLDAPSSEAIDLPFDKDVISSDSNREDGSLDSEGRTIPAEIFPSTITSKGIEFQMGSTEDGNNNAVASNGQEITIPSDYKQVHLLATSTSGDVTETFKVNDKPVDIEIQDYKENVGGWDNFGAGAFLGIKRAPVAWVSTHTHTSDGNSAYDYAYLFNYKIDLPEGETTITLPDNENILVFAMTASNNDNADTTPAGSLYDKKEPAETFSLNVENGTGSGNYPQGTEVSIAAEVPIGYAFEKWIGPVEDENAINTTVKMPAEDVAVKAVLTELGSNFALDKEATASGYVNEREIPEFAVDGDRNTKWCQTGRTDKWLQVDLEQEHTIDRWIVRHAGDGGENTGWNTRDFKLQASDDGENWLDVDSIEGNTENISNKRMDPFTARYVRLYVTNPTNTSDTAARIYELELYGPELDKVSIAVDDDTLERNQTANITITKAMLSNGDIIDLTDEDAEIEYCSSDTDVVTIEDGVITAKNAGTSEVYVKVTLDGITVESNKVTVTVGASIESIKGLIEDFIESEDLIGPIIPQLKNSLKQAEHHKNMGRIKQAIKHMENFIKHLNNPSMDDYISETAKDILNNEAEAIIKNWSELVDKEK
ncbi:discoidin domain-containing protein [Schnuerera sp. xch1]|uniref:glycoside hydrolase family 38 N-terminal domain-containing protein n=1 Tax=Schnuerera sp. xch1 TaxID=2874283 RepID=UPI001CC13A75|nr:glycoside hydrolase family 38 C-terminal domain-containing protein [Schnuerera sp. xch1]MBZ2175071.1 discoidin domain-containing protein [Schnuerera sp. xch1]